ncbi:phospholipase D-like domain-containing protein [Altererythrobacter sp. Z27]|uniref:phospholipase D-like domain-containing protein n=1 Tax=Altererythrobacter sp. Z27 TaxID=3461147 RepID=UPI00404437B9
MAEADGAPTLPEASLDYRDPAAFTIAGGDHVFSFHPEGADRLASLIELIESASETLQLCFYMFQPDHVGTLVRGALVQAAQRGVKVHLIIDAFGSDAPEAFFEPIVRAGGRFSLFSPRWNVRYLIRNHQKFAIADGARVITGGFNVSDHYFAAPQENGWSDLAVTIEGPVTARFVEWFGELEEWVVNGGSRFLAIRRLVRDWKEGDSSVQLLLGGPTRITSAWARTVKQDIARSKRLDLVMAYFSPPRSIRRLIRKLAQRGGARLVMAGKSDNTTTIGASRALYGNLLRAGVSIAEFEPTKLHLKLMVIDDVTYFGSANFDMRSIRLNLELMVRVEDAALAQKARGMIDHLESASRPVTLEWYRREATLFNRIRWRLSWFLVSVIDYTVARRLNLGL